MMRQWRGKSRTSNLLHVMDLAEILAIFGPHRLVDLLPQLTHVAFVQFIVSYTDEDEDFLVGSSIVLPAPIPCGILGTTDAVSEKLLRDDEEIMAGAVAGKIPSDVLETSIVSARQGFGARHGGSPGDRSRDSRLKASTRRPSSRVWPCEQRTTEAAAHALPWLSTLPAWCFLKFFSSCSLKYGAFTHHDFFGTQAHHLNSRCPDDDEPQHRALGDAGLNKSL